MREQLKNKLISELAYSSFSATKTAEDLCNLKCSRIGYHYGANSSFSTSAKRKRVIQPEEIESLGNNGFIMLDNYTATISKGTLV